MIKLAAGIDIGGTNSVIGLVDREGKIYDSRTVSTGKFKDPLVFVKEISVALNEMIIEKEEEFELFGVGVGAPNANYYMGTVDNPPNLPWEGIVPLEEMLEKELSLPVEITNDANAAAVGEMIFGGARSMKDFIVLTLGTGLGSGIVVNGEVLYGKSGFAGELGHMNMIPNGRLCGCGQKGCLETYVSATGIVRTVQELIEEGFTPGILNNYKREEITSRLIAEAAENGDTMALEAFERTAEVFATAIATAVVFSSPEAIFLFGGLANAGKLLTDPAEKAIEKKLMSTFKGTFVLRISELQDKNVAVLGAAALAWKKQEEKLAE